MKRRLWVQGALVVIITVSLGLGGCAMSAQTGGSVMVTAEEAKAGLLAESEAMQAIIGEGWSTDDQLQVPGACTQPDGQPGGSWQIDTEGTVSVTAQEAADAVQRHLESRGFSAEQRDAGDFGFDVVAFQPDGLSIQFSVGSNGFASLDGQSVCFPRE